MHCRRGRLLRRAAGFAQGGVDGFS
jgi:hypothetical protein